ncbi:MAG: DNA methyltransferase [Acidimicrobiales bacterium]|jgi:site-specific DNA-methyltransferase (adenine-specific)
MSADRWQLLPDLGAEEFAALKASIAESGVLIPVTYDAETNEVVDGHQRLRAVAELRAEGTPVPEPMKQLRHFGSDEERIAFVVSSNVQRRKLSSAQRRDLVAEALRRLPSLSDRRLALMSGVDGKTVASVRAELVGRAEIPHVEARADTLGRQQPARRRRPPATIFVQSARDAARAVSALQALGGDASGLIGLTRAEERARTANLARIRAEAATGPSEHSGDTWELRTGDFRDVLADLADQSVDAIVTDPPYDNDGVPLYEPLGTFCLRVLKPGRLAVVYAGNLQLDREMSFLERGGLTYMWHGVNVLAGRHTRVRTRMVFGQHRSVLLYSAGPYRPRTWLNDVVFAEGRGGPEERPLHPWQQALEPVRHWVRQVTEPGELIVDPFIGSGTTAVAAVMEGRRFVGCDIDPGCVETTRRRLVELAARSEDDRAGA